MQVSRREVVGRLMVTSGVVAGGYGLISNDRPLMAATAISWPSRSTKYREALSELGALLDATANRL